MNKLPHWKSIKGKAENWENSSNSKQSADFLRTKTTNKRADSWIGKLICKQTAVFVEQKL